MKTAIVDGTTNNDRLPREILIVSPDDGKQIKGVVQLIHGMAEHKERYLPFMEFLAENGYVAAIHDIRGHGKSVKDDSDYGYFYKNGARKIIEDVHDVTEELKEMYGEETPYVLFGHSMGSLIARCYIKQYDFELDGVILSGSPSENKALPAARAIATAIGTFKGERYRSKFLNNLSFGSYAKDIEDRKTDFDWLSHDEKVVQEYIDNPLDGFMFTINGYLGLFNLLEWTYSLSGYVMRNPDMKIHFVSGEEDPCMVSEKAFMEAVERPQHAGYQNVTYKLYPGMRHEILNEVDKQIVYDDLLEIINEWSK